MWTSIQSWRVRVRQDETSAYHRYERRAAYPLFLLGVMFLAAVIIRFDPQSSPADLRYVSIVVPLTWFAFALDYVISLVLVPNRWHYVRTHVLQGLALLFPPFRLLLLGHIFHVLRTTPLRSGERARMYLMYLTTLLLVFSAVAVVYFERGAANSNIATVGEGLWWGGETVSTVGYGDFYPVTLGGRIVAGVLFVNGVALLSVVTAGLAQRFNVGDSAAVAKRPAGASAGSKARSTRDDLAELHAEIARLEASLSHVSSRLADMVARSDLSLHDANPGTPTEGGHGAVARDGDQDREGQEGGSR